MTPLDLGLFRVACRYAGARGRYFIVRKCFIANAVEIPEHPGVHVTRQCDIARFVLCIQNRPNDQMRLDREDVEATVAGSSSRASLV